MESRFESNHKDKNNLSDDSLIYWHDLILPSNVDGVPVLSSAGAEPLELKYGERVLIILVNHTMMTDRIYLYDVYSELFRHC